MQGIADASLEPLVAFHGHMCPGLAIGVRAAGIGLREVGRPPRQPVTVLAETAMCSVDGIQFLTGCTLGNGDLVFRDHGKNAFTFVRRSDGKTVRVVARPDALAPDPEHQNLRSRIDEGVATDAERARFSELHLARSEMILALDEDELFSITTPGQAPELGGDRTQETAPCSRCGEAVMRTRLVPRGEAFYCLACHETGVT